MRRLTILGLGALTLVLGMQAAAAGESATEARNKERAIALYNAAINEKNFDKASAYLGPHYIQHSPTAKDGREGLKEAIAGLKQSFPASHAEIKRAFADGDFVILHVKTTLAPGQPELSVVDIIRFEKGKAAEHWDITQPVPAQSANSNGVF